MPRFALAAILIAAAPAADQRRYPVADFERIVVRGPYDVVVDEAPVTAAMAEGTPRALAALRVTADAGTLTIQPRADVPGGVEPARLRVSTRRLRAASLFGSGQLSIARMAAPRVQVTLNGDGAIAVAGIAADHVSAVATGAGALSLAGDAREALVGAVGAPQVEGDALRLRDLTVNSQGPATVTLRASGTARVIATGPATVRIRGGARCITRGSDVGIDCAP